MVVVIRAQQTPEPRVSAQKRDCSSRSTTDPKNLVTDSSTSAPFGQPGSPSQGRGGNRGQGNRGGLGEDQLQSGLTMYSEGPQAFFLPCSPTKLWMIQNRVAPGYPWGVVSFLLQEL